MKLNNYTTIIIHSIRSNCRVFGS